MVSLPTKITGVWGYYNRKKIIISLATIFFLTNVGLHPPPHVLVSLLRLRPPHLLLPWCCRCCSVPTSSSPGACCRQIPECWAAAAAAITTKMVMPPKNSAGAPREIVAPAAEQSSAPPESDIVWGGDDVESAYQFELALARPHCLHRCVMPCITQASSVTWPLRHSVERWKIPKQIFHGGNKLQLYSSVQEITSGS